MAGLPDLSQGELDTMRESANSTTKEKAERIVKRIIYLGADSTPVRRLEQIQKNPSLINMVGFSKRATHKAMESFNEEVDLGQHSRTKQSLQIKGLFIQYLSNPAQHEDDLNTVDVFAQANQYLAELKTETGIALPPFDANTFPPAIGS